MMSDVRRLRGVFDIAAALLLALLGAVAVAVFPDGRPMRLILVAPVLLFAPGYLLLQAVLVPKRPPLTRVLHGVLSMGISLALVGLVALSAALVRGAFKPAVIVVLVTLTCIALAATGTYRRLYQGAPTNSVPAQRTPRIRRVGFAPPSRFFRRAEKPSVAARPAPAEDLPVVTATVAEAPPQERTQVTSAAIATQQESP